MKSRFHDWGDARLFLAVAELGSTLAASRALGIGQTTVARRIDVLEHALDVALFTRDTRGFHLTEDGAALVPAAEALRDAADALEAAAHLRRNKRRTPIRFTAWDEVMTVVFADIFTQFIADNPGTVFEFIVADRPLDLTAGEADIALRLSSDQPNPDLIGRRVGQTAWTYYASESYAAKNGLPRSYDDEMNDHTVVLLKHISSDRRNIQTCNTANDVLMAIRTGQGIGPIPILQGDRQPGLVRCFPPPIGSELQAWLLTSETAYARPEIKAFMSFAAPHFAKALEDHSIV